MEKQKRKFRFPIRWKAITMIVSLAVVIIEVAVAYFAIMMSKSNQATYKGIASSLAYTVSKVVNVEDVKYLKNEVNPKYLADPVKPVNDEEGFTDEQYATYAAQFDYLQDDGIFNKTRDFLRSLNNDKAPVQVVDCVYLSYIDPVNKNFIYLVDSAPVEDACHPGCIDPLYEENQFLIDNPARGFAPYITNTSIYGWLITAGSPIMDGSEVVGYAMVDISMEMVRKNQANSIVRLFFYMLATLVLLGAAGVVWVSLWMIRPLKKLTSLALSYKGSDPKDTHERFRNFTNNTHDEITDLTDSIKTMEQDVYDRFNALSESNRQLTTSREETKKMAILANQDGLTGVHNKVSYNSEVERINSDIENGEKIDFAVVMVDLNYLKEVNDTYGHDTGDIALIKLASMICETFAFSPVYRVGGDEFVVICRGKDFLKISQLVEAFKDKVQKSIKNSKAHDGEHISAAVGYSTFDSSDDKTVDDVFKRADKAMYENKREMKNEK